MIAIVFHQKAVILYISNFTAYAYMINNTQT